MKTQKGFTLFFGIFFLILLFTCSAVHAASGTKPIELKVATWNPPPPFPISASAVKWAKMVEEKSGGRVKLTFYWGGGLASLRDTYRTVQSGVADIGFWLPGVLPGIHTLNEYTLFLDRLKAAEKEVNQAAMNTLGSKADPELVKKMEEVSERLRMVEANKIF